MISFTFESEKDNKVEYNNNKQKTRFIGNRLVFTSGERKGGGAI